MQITAQQRSQLGKKNKALRKGGGIPAVIFGPNTQSIPISIEKSRFTKVYQDAGETDLIDLKIDDKIEKVLIKDVQLHPVSMSPLHVGFFRVNLKEKTRANIPVEVVGEERCVILKSGEGVLLTLLDEIEVEALPTDLPHSFVVDISELTQIGQGITIDGLQYDRQKVGIVDLKPEELVVKIDSAQMVEEVEEAVDEAAAIEGIQATEELSPEEKAARADKDKKEASDD